MSKNIFLVGPMAAGKSTIGKRLADALDYAWVDTDQEIQRRTGVDMHWIFDKEGEEGFRRREQELVEELTAQESIVISTGAGTILSAQSRDYLKQRGVVIYLKVSLNKQVVRTEKDRVRPLLRTEDRPERLRQLAEERNELYASIADFEMATDKSNVDVIVKQLLKQIKQLFSE